MPVEITINFTALGFSDDEFVVWSESYSKLEKLNPEGFEREVISGADAEEKIMVWKFSGADAEEKIMVWKFSDTRLLTDRLREELDYICCPKWSHSLLWQEQINMILLHELLSTREFIEGQSEQEGPLGEDAKERCQQYDDNNPVP